MPAGDRFTHFSSSERAALDATIRRSEELCRAEISVFVGNAEGGPRAYAETLHASLTAPERSMLVLVDPAARALEIVTGSWVRRQLSDKQCELAAVTMQSAFADGDVVGGLRRGIAMLAEHARPVRTLHAAEDQARS